MADPADQAFDELFRREHPRLVALALVLTGSREAAGDIAQEALIRAYRAWSSIRDLDRPGAWARRVTINLATDWHRAQRREQDTRERLAAMVPGIDCPSPDRERERFWQAVRDLPGRQRTVIALYYLEDMSVADVASTLEIAEGTVKATLFKARRALAKTLTLEVDR